LRPINEYHVVDRGVPVHALLLIYCANALTAAFRIFAKAAGLPMRAVGPATDSAPRTCPPLTTGTATQVKPAINSSASNAYRKSRYGNSSGSPRSPEAQPLSPR